ncbi:hypothetical protein [Pseudoalteromonas sp. G4]|uniref:hypothetical protein n=1 Tax=Pseudoalteromonas sp. G4 TaxID=2992761 RepID=UPI00237D8E99|nr:hypothetical protein [Pseudoalteromonas sp. G4]MDE3271234.1 hypothetical protein [Pseudoalteromonas sp. G4]
MVINLSLLERLSFLQKFIKNKVGYFNQQLQTLDRFSSTAENFQPRLIIVSKKHYKEVRKSYSAVSKKDLDAILALNSIASNNLSISKVSVNSQIDGFDVKTITYDVNLIDKIPSSAMLLPETELLSFYCSDKQCLSIDTPGGELYFAKPLKYGVSDYKGGLLNSVDTFIKSVGLSDKAQAVYISRLEYSNLLQKLLKQISIVDLVRSSRVFFTKSLNLSKIHVLYLAPLTFATLFLVAVYGMNYLHIETINSESKTLNSEATNVLQKRQNFISLNEKLEVLNDEFNKINRKHTDWDIISIAIASGMEIQNLVGNDEFIEMRGVAPKASEVLEKLNESEMVNSAIFTTPIRKSRRKDAFTLKVVRVIK